MTLQSQLTTIDILRYRAGVCREFVKLFEEMCQVAHINKQFLFLSLKIFFSKDCGVKGAKHRWLC